MNRLRVSFPFHDEPLDFEVAELGLEERCQPVKLPTVEAAPKFAPMSTWEAVSALALGTLLGSIFAVCAFFFKRLLLSAVLVGVLFAAGCTSAQLAADEALAHGALDKVEKGINWATAHQDVITAALDQAAASAPNNATLQHAVALAKAANTAGHRDEAIAIISATKSVLAPVASVGSGK